MSEARAAQAISAPGSAMEGEHRAAHEASAGDVEEEHRGAGASALGAATIKMGTRFIKPVR